MLRIRSRVLVLLSAFASPSCGGGDADFFVHETGIVVESSAPFTRGADLRVRVESTVDAALAYWGGDWTSLRGRTITLSRDAYVSCGGSDRSLGCYDGDIRLSTSDPGTGAFLCIEQTVLVHEIGHAVIGDPLHADPRWMQLEPVRDALSGRVGYTADGETDCTIFLSVWRHVLGVP